MLGGGTTLSTGNHERIWSCYRTKYEPQKIVPYIMISHDKELPIPACLENGFKYLGFMVNENGIMWQMKEHILSRVKDGMEQWKYVTNRMLGKASILNSYIMSRL